MCIRDSQYGEGDAAKSQDIADNYITDGCVGIFGCNEGATVGTGNAIKGAGGGVIGVGFDKSDAILGLSLIHILSESMDSILKDKQEENIRPIRQAKQYIQQNYMKSITLDDVSSVAGFNATYFSSLFKKETGSNFVEYLSEIRMNRAKDLLKETNMSIAAVCEAVGYNDLKHFTKSFKKAAGIKPGEYRKLYS